MTKIESNEYGQTYVLRCACSDHHFLLFEYSDYSEKDNPPDEDFQFVYLSSNFTPPFWSRIKAAFKMILGSQYSHEEIVLNKDSLNELIKNLQEVQKISSDKVTYDKVT